MGETKVEYFEDKVDETIDIDGTVDFTNGYVRHNLFLPYNTLKSILNLDEQTRPMDEMLLNSSHLAVEHHISRIISLRKITEEVLPAKGIIIPYEYPIQVVLSCFDTVEQKEIAAKPELDNGESKLIILPNSLSDGHNCNITYIAGYKSGEGPADLAEAIVKIFILKRHVINNEIELLSDNATKGLDLSSMPADVVSILEPYKRR
ncbi:MAG: hypothetical protein K6F69_01990 [Treponema sp.]|nr:hypothetical protein [Treponema sp.]